MNSSKEFLDQLTAEEAMNGAINDYFDAAYERYGIDGSLAVDEAEDESIRERYGLDEHQAMGARTVAVNQVRTCIPGLTSLQEFMELIDG